MGNVVARRYDASVDPQPVVASHSPFPVAPADVPVNAVRAVKRTLLRGLGADYPDIEDPMDDELARLVVAVVIAALAQPSGDGAVNATVEQA